MDINPTFLFKKNEKGGSLQDVIFRVNAYYKFPDLGVFGWWREDCDSLGDDSLQVKDSIGSCKVKTVT